MRPERLAQIERAASEALAAQCAHAEARGDGLEEGPVDLDHWHWQSFPGSMIQQHGAALVLELVEALGELQKMAERWHLASGHAAPRELWASNQGSAWQCSGCRHVCRAWKCPRRCGACGKEGYYSGSYSPELVRAHDDAAWQAKLRELGLEAAAR